jgi:23S rRNA (uridine2552-2'-O)-methyltransferase
MKRSASSQRWLQRQEHDPFVKKAQQEGFRSRAVYKLMELNEKDRLLKPNMTILDLGAAPGGWSQWTMKYLQNKVNVIAIDILPIEPLEGVTILQGDFIEEKTLQMIRDAFISQHADLVMSDLAPNMSGMKAVDQPKAIMLAELALETALELLKPKGDFVTKLFQGEGFDVYLQQLRQYFQKVLIRKPKASRPESREVYLVARHKL